MLQAKLLPLKGQKSLCYNLYYRLNDNFQVDKCQVQYKETETAVGGQQESKHHVSLERNVVGITQSGNARSVRSSSVATGSIESTRNTARFTEEKDTPTHSHL